MQRLKELAGWALSALMIAIAVVAFGAPASALASVIAVHRDLLVLPAIMGATLGANMITMADYAKLLGPDNKLAPIIEMLNLNNEILDDAIVQEGNTTTGWIGNVRTGLPPVVFRLANQGVPPSKSTTAQLVEQAGRMEAWSEVDEMIAELASDLGQFRLSQAQPFFESMNQTFASKLFYGNAGLAPEEFTGLAPRFSTSVQATAASGANIIKAGGAGADNTSIWLINWNPATVFLIYAILALSLDLLWGSSITTSARKPSSRPQASPATDCARTASSSSGVSGSPCRIGEASSASRTSTSRT